MLPLVLTVLGNISTVIMNVSLVVALWVFRDRPGHEGLAPMRWVLWWKALEYSTVTLLDGLVLLGVVERTDPTFVLWRRNGGRLVSAVSMVGFLLMLWLKQPAPPVS